MICKTKAREIAMPHETFADDRNAGLGTILFAESGWREVGTQVLCLRQLRYPPLQTTQRRAPQTNRVSRLRANPGLREGLSPWPNSLSPHVRMPPAFLIGYENISLASV